MKNQELFDKLATVMDELDSHDDINVFVVMSDEEKRFRCYKGINQKIIKGIMATLIKDKHLLVLMAVALYVYILSHEEDRKNIESRIAEMENHKTEEDSQACLNFIQTISNL